MSTQKKNQINSFYFKKTSIFFNMLKFLRYSSEVASKQFCEKLYKLIRFFPLFLVVRLPLGDEFLRKSLFYSLRFNLQIKGV
jgi:hypothetical protein